MSAKAHGKTALLRDRPLDSLPCLNEQCPDFGRAYPGLLKVRYHRAEGAIRYLHCTTCGDEFSERKGTPLFGLRISEEKAFEILNHVTEGVGVRATGRLCGVKQDTVTHIVRAFGAHFKQWHDARVRDLEVNEVQLDEKWSFVGKKTKRFLMSTW